MLDWLMTAVDSSRPHDIGFNLSWHARIMVISWSILLPVGVIWARFLKVMPGQNWPEELDNKTWWYGHLAFQYIGAVLMIPALWLILIRQPLPHQSGIHGWMGWTLAVLALCQIIGGLLRGSKGGPTEPHMRGAHYDMTTRRVVFEYFHKLLGYMALVFGAMTTISGMWQANAPRLLWLIIIIWWLCIIIIFCMLQIKVRAFDTYQAIWGPDPNRPGNLRKPIGFLIYRINKD